MSVLDGGLAKWVAEGRETCTDNEVGSEEDYKVTINQEIYRNFAQIAEIEKEVAEGKSHVQIVDARGEP